MTPVSAIEILGKLKESAPNLQALRDQIDAVPDTDQNAIFDHLSQEIVKLQPAEQVVVKQNLKDLETQTTTHVTKKSLDSLLNAVRTKNPAMLPEAAPAPAPTAPAEAPKKESSYINSVGDAVASVADTVLPETVSSRMSRGQKIAAVTAVSAGIVLAVAAIWKGWDGVKKMVIYGGAAIAGAIGIDWVMGKISKSGGIFNALRDTFMPWKKYGLERGPYNEAKSLFKSKKEAAADEIRTKYFGGKNSPEYEEFMKDMREEYGDKTRVVDGIEMTTVSQALPLYTKAISEALYPIRLFLEQNKEGITAIALFSYGMSDRVRGIINGTIGLTKDGILELMRFIKNSVVHHPILSLLAVTGGMYGMKKVGDMEVPKDPKNLQLWFEKQLASGAEGLDEFGETVISDEDWGMLAGILQGSADAITKLKDKTAELLSKAGQTVTEAISLSPQELVENKNRFGIGLFVRFMEGIRNSNRALDPQYEALKRFTKSITYPLKAQDIATLKDLTKDFGIQIEEEAGCFVYRMRDENAVWHTRRLCINPALPLKEQAAMARIFIADPNSGEALNQFGKPLDQLRELSQYIFFKDVKNENEAREKLKAEMNNGGVIVIRGGIAYLYSVAEGGVKQFVVAPCEVVKHLFNGVTGNFSMAEAALDYAEGLLPVTISGATSTLLQGGGFGKFGFNFLCRTALYPITGTFETGKLLYKSVFLPMRQGKMAEILLDQRIMVSATFNRRLAQMKSVATAILPSLEVKALSIQYRELAALEEARGLIAKARYNAIGRLGYIDAAQSALNRMKSPLNAGQLALDAGPLDEAISKLHEAIAPGSKPLTTASLVPKVKTVAPSVTPTPKPAATPTPKPTPATGPKPAPTTAPKPSASAVPEAPGASAAARVEEAASEITDEAKLAKLAAAPGVFKNSREFLRLAQEQGLVRVNPDLLALIDQSPGAQRILDGALDAAKGGEFAELKNALKAANGARNLRIGLNGVGLVGDVFGFYMAMSDFQANGCKIELAKQTKNQALIDIYSHMRLVNTAEMAQSGVSGVVGVGTMVYAYWSGQSFLTAISASGALILLPAAVATVAGSYMARKATEVSETWLRNSKDWVQALTPAEILEKLDELGPGERNNKSAFGLIDWQEWGKGTIAEQGARWAFTSRESYEAWEKSGENTIEGANQGSRYELTKAYIIHTSAVSCPQRPGEPDAEFEKRFDQFVIDQMMFIGNATQGSFSRMLGDFYENARTHASLMARSRQLRQEGRAEYLEWQDEQSGEKRSFNVADYQDTTWAGKGDVPSQMSLIGRQTDVDGSFRIAQLVSLRNTPGATVEQRKFVVKQQLLLSIHDRLNKLNGRMESGDFDGVMGWDSEAKAASRLAAAQMVEEILEAESGRLVGLMETPKGVGIEDYKQSVGSLTSLCDEKDMIRFQREAEQRGLITSGQVTDPESLKQRLSVQGIAGSLMTTAKKGEATQQLEERKKALKPEEVASLSRSAGETYLTETGVKNKGDYWQIQYGQWFNKYLYIKFLDGTWQVSLGNFGNGPWNNPATYGVSVGFDATSGRYNKIIRDLEKINADYRK